MSTARQPARRKRASAASISVRPSALAVLRGIHGEQAEVAAVAALLGVDTADGRAVLLRDQERALRHVPPHLVFARAVAVDEEALDLVGGVDESGDRARIRGSGGAQRGHECGLERDRFGFAQAHHQPRRLVLDEVLELLAELRRG